MATSIISLFLFPLLGYKLYTLYLHLSASRSPAPTGVPLSQLVPAKKKVAPPPPPPTLYSLLTVSNVSLLLLLLTFAFLLAQLSSYNEKPLSSYDPYAVLGLTSSATPAELKRAYRALSLKWHPDKNVENAEEANRQFIAITKAYESLTSEAAQENIARYGNPDGPQAVSVTIGLPSFLTKRENEMRVLLLYFLVFLVLPPVAVYLWWHSAKDYADNGVMVETLKYTHTQHIGTHTIALPPSSWRRLRSSHPHVYLCAALLIHPLLPPPHPCCVSPGTTTRSRWRTTGRATSSRRWR